MLILNDWIPYNALTLQKILPHSSLLSQHVLEVSFQAPLLKTIILKTAQSSGEMTVR